MIKFNCHKKLLILNCMLEAFRGFRKWKLDLVLRMDVDDVSGWFAELLYLLYGV